MTEKELETQAKLDAQQSQRQDNFLSPWIEKYVSHFRQSNQEWHEFALELNRVALSIAQITGDVVVGKSTFDLESVAYRLLLRAICDFEAAVILAERGIVDQADVLARGIFEAGFWMGYLRNSSSTAAEAMLQDSFASGFAALKFERRLAVAQHGESDEIVREIDKAITSRKKGKAQNVSELAFLSGYETYYRYYKELSSSVAHTSMHSLHSYMNDNGDGTFSGHLIGPDAERISPSLSIACLALCLNLRSYSEIAGGTTLDVQLQDMLVRWDKLPNSWTPKHSK